MRVPDELRECVCFIESRWSDQEASVGSAFLGGVRTGFEDHFVVYAITAKHCIEHSALGLADEILLKVNTPGGVEVLPTDVAKWMRHPTADVAVGLLGGLPDAVEYRAWDILGSSATSTIVEERNIGSGDDLFVTGLLVHHPGVTRNMPIARIGCISALPTEPVQLETGPDVVALAEVRSIGGLSGSPVFVHLPFWRDSEQGDIFVGGGGKASSGGENWLFGLMHGFYPVGRNDPDGISGGDENLNTGIAVVVLVDRILDLINHPTQRLLRDAARRAAEATSGATSAEPDD